MRKTISILLIICTLVFCLVVIVVYCESMCYDCVTIMTSVYELGFFFKFWVKRLLWLVEMRWEPTLGGSMMNDSLIEYNRFVRLCCGFNEKKLLFCLFVKKNGLPLQPLNKKRKKWELLIWITYQFCTLFASWWSHQEVRKVVYVSNLCRISFGSLSHYAEGGFLIER